MRVLGPRFHIFVDNHADGFLPRRDIAVILGPRFLVFGVLFLVFGRPADTLARSRGGGGFGGPLAALATLRRVLLPRTAVTATAPAATAAATRAILARFAFLASFRSAGPFATSLPRRALLADFGFVSSA